LRGALASIAIALFAGKVVVPAQPMPSLAVVTRARVEVARDSVIVGCDVTFSRGDWTSGDLELYVAFGAPGVPRAFDAGLIPTGEDDATAPLADRGEALPVDRAVSKPDRAVLLLGSPHMAGEVLHVREPALRRAFSSSGRVTLRLRSLVAAPPADAQGFREVVVRLGTQPSSPLAVSVIEVAAKDGSVHIDSADARLCGSDADAYPLAVSVAPSPATVVTYPRPTSPLAVVRHASDDLCVRYASH
jgi:hypothetical protein